jgi:pentatricopeptide repeat protein
LETDTSSPFAELQDLAAPLGEESSGISQPELIARLNDATKRGSVDGVQAAVHDLLTSPTPPRTIIEYNVAMEALAATRAYMGSLQPILDVYNTLLDRGILPNAKTYATLMIVLCQCDNEVYTTINGLEGHLHMHGLFLSDRALNGSLRQENDECDCEWIASLKEENNFHFAVKIWEALVSTWGPHQGSNRSYRALRHMVYTSLMSSCARAGNVDMAIRVFAHLGGV